MTKNQKLRLLYEMRLIAHATNRQYLNQRLREFEYDIWESDDQTELYGWAEYALLALIIALSSIGLCSIICWISHS